MLKIPYHTVAAHNCCTVPASSQHVRLKDLRVVTGGGKKKKKKSFVNNFLRRALLKNYTAQSPAHWKHPSYFRRSTTFPEAAQPALSPGQPAGVRAGRPRSYTK